MTGVAFDSNVLSYAELEPHSSKAELALRLVEHCGCQGVVAAQALGELLAVVRRRLPAAFAEACRQVEDYRGVFSVVPTDIEIILAAGAFAERHRPPLWDAVIWQASRRGGATVLLTEDMQDGFAADGMRALNPFAAPDWAALAADLARGP